MDLVLQGARRRLSAGEGEPAPRARMAGMGGRQAAEGQGARSGRHQPRHQRGRASRAGGASASCAWRSWSAARTSSPSTDCGFAQRPFYRRVHPTISGRSCRRWPRGRGSPRKRFSWKELEVDFRLAAGDDVGERSGAAAGVGPAERAVPGVQVQVRIPRGADAGHVGGRRRPQSGPELRVLHVAGARKERLGAPQERAAAYLVQLGAVAAPAPRCRRCAGDRPGARRRACIRRL